MEKHTLEIHRPDKPALVQEVDAGVYPIGSDEDNKIILPDDGVSGRHAVIFIGADHCWVEDLDSRTGTYVEGARVSGRALLEPGQQVSIGRYTVVVTRPPGAPAVDQAPGAETPAEKSPKESGHVVRSRRKSPSERKRLVKKQIHDELVQRLNLRRLTVSGVGEEELHEKALDTINAIIKEVGMRLPPDIDPVVLAKEVYDEAIGLGPLEELLADEQVTEIMVNGHDRIYVEKEGKLVLTDMTFFDDSSVLAIIERIVSPLGRRIDESQPYVDARLKDGSRVNAIIHPLSLVGPCITIRKFSKIPFTDEDMVRFGTMVPLMAQFIRACVLARKNIVISGGTGSGKTTLLNVSSCYLPPDDRIVTIEDAAELRLTQAHVIRLEARPPNIENKGAVTIRDLVRNALRMRPDRIVVGECRGGEALDMLQAMNTGHDGSLTTVHANSPRDVISRLETMVLMSGMDLPVRAIREQIASAINAIVHVARLSDGTRKIVNITEVVGLEGERITMQDLFEFRQTGIGDEGNVLGHFAPLGSVPTFADEFKTRGISVDPGMFDPRQWEVDE